MQLRQFHFLCGFAVLSCLFFAGVALTFPDGARADAKDQLTGHGGIPVPLQQVIRKERKRGPVFIAIPVAYVFGLGTGHSPAYCSPSIRATNSSNAPIEEVIFGIEFHTKSGPAGGSVTRLAGIKVGQQDTHYFYQLTVADCRGLDGVVTVLRCVYSTGESCLADVQAVAYGAVPLRMKPR